MKAALFLVILLSLSTAQASGVGSFLQLVELLGKKVTHQTPQEKIKHINLRSFTDNTTRYGLEIRAFNAPRKPVEVEFRTLNHSHIDLVSETLRLTKEAEPKIMKLELIILGMEKSTPIEVEKLLREIAPAFGMSHELIKRMAKENRNEDLLLRHKVNADKIFDVLTKGLEHHQAGMTKPDFLKARNILLSYAMDAQRL